MVNKHFDRESEKQHENNDIMFSIGILKISVDDETGIPIREPGQPNRTNVWKITASLGLKSSTKSLEDLDHDFHRASIRPSLILFMKTPFESTSWRNGYVTTSLKEGATQQSTAMRHAVELTQQIQETLLLRDNTMMPFAFLIRSDGGNDRNPKNMTTMLSSIYTFLENDLDFLIHLVTAADTSYVNEVEGIMPLANVVLQNQAYARGKMTDDMKKII